MMCVQFIFKPGTYDDQFHRLDDAIDAYARSLSGFIRTETWTSDQTGTETWTSDQTGMVNAIYYFQDQTSVAWLARYPEHREAKGQVHRWYDGYRIVVSEVKATYGDDRLPS